MAAALERVDGDLELLEGAGGPLPRRMPAADGGDPAGDRPARWPGPPAGGPLLQGLGGELRGPARPSRRPGASSGTAATRDWDRAEQDWAALEDAIGRLEPAFDECSDRVDARGRRHGRDREADRRTGVSIPRRLDLMQGGATHEDPDRGRRSGLPAAAAELPPEVGVRGRPRPRTAPRPGASSRPAASPWSSPTG